MPPLGGAGLYGAAILNVSSRSPARSGAGEACTRTGLGAWVACPEEAGAAVEEALGAGSEPEPQAASATRAVASAMPEEARGRRAMD